MVSAILCLSHVEKRLLELFVQTSFRINEATPLRLSSGRYSPYYADCKMALAHPEARALIGAAVLDRFRDVLLSVDAVGGLELSAYPLAVSISDATYRDPAQHMLLAFVVRKQPKQHGLGKQLEGLPFPEMAGKKVLIVDDVITTGASTLQAIRRCREEGLDVTHAVVLLDREEDGGRQNIEAEGVPLSALFTLSQLTETLKAQAEG